MDLSGLKMFSLEGKTAIVTGAGRTTGLCYAMATALHDAGAAVVLMDINQDVFELAESLGGKENRYFAVRADLTDKASREAGFNEAVELLGGRLDILLNGAGMQYREDALDFPEDKWMQIINLNLNAVWFMGQLAGNFMKKQGGGKIINIASMNTFITTTRVPAYVASKGGVGQLTKAMAHEWAQYNINANAIAPGFMVTAMTADNQFSEQGKGITKRIPAGHWGYPEDLMGTAVFLAAPASDYLNGAIIPVDGGYLSS